MELTSDQRGSVTSATVTLEASFDDLRDSVPASIGIAIAFPDQCAVRSLGPWSVGVAWSTIKVPLSIAALRRDRVHARDLVVKTISESDNPASESLWSLLGDPVEAAQRVQAVIAEAGDETTVVQSRRLRAGFTPFGQTSWALRDQARFAANLVDVAEADVVIDLMRRLAPDQRWGLAARGIAAKGGWGPGREDGYLVRQFAIVPVASGHVGVALAADAATFETGVAVINLLTDWLLTHLPSRLP